MTKAEIFQLMLLAEEKITQVCKLCNEEKNGGYMCVTDAQGQLEAAFLVGKVPLEKAKMYAFFAQEKATRLSLHKDHVTSWQSRNETEKKYGGAIRVNDHIFSFSGLLELFDEFLMALLAQKFFAFSDTPIRRDYLMIIASISESRFIETILPESWTRH